MQYFGYDLLVCLSPVSNFDYRITIYGKWVVQHDSEKTFLLHDFVRELQY
jgi:hypothetical protein